MNTSKTGADLPAPLSLTLDEVREVAGGTTTLALVVVRPAGLAERGQPGHVARQCGRWGSRTGLGRLTALS
jgi:hypothetical protein